MHPIQDLDARIGAEAFQGPFGIPARMDRHALDRCRGLPMEFGFGQQNRPRRPTDLAVRREFRLAGWFYLNPCSVFHEWALIERIGL